VTNFDGPVAPQVTGAHGVGNRGGAADAHRSGHCREKTVAAASITTDRDVLFFEMGIDQMLAAQNDGDMTQCSCRRSADAGAKTSPASGVFSRTS
jgi:hypothetical protein